MYGNCDLVSVCVAPEVNQPVLLCVLGMCVVAREHMRLAVVSYSAEVFGALCRCNSCLAHCFGQSSFRFLHFGSTFIFFLSLMTEDNCRLRVLSFNSSYLRVILIYTRVSPTPPPQLFNEFVHIKSEDIAMCFSFRFWCGEVEKCASCFPPTAPHAHVSVS